MTQHEGQHPHQLDPSLGQYPEVDLHPEMHTLHHSGVSLPDKGILSAEEMLLQYGINGQLKAEITLPALTPDRSDYKKLGVVDFGKDADEYPVTIMQYEGREMSHYGKTKSRYGVVALNYAPNSAALAYAPVTGTLLDIGRNSKPGENFHNTFGLQSTPDNKSVSRERHISMFVDSAGRVVIMDASANGTTIKTASGAEKVVDAQTHRKDELGSIALNLVQKEQQLQTRNEQLFAPFLFEEDEKVFNYDHLFAEDRDVQPKTELDPDAKLVEELKKRAAVTEQSVRDAIPYLGRLRVDPVIDHAVADFKDKHPESFRDEDIMKGLRENAELRLAVGTRLMDLVRQYPYGFVDDQWKNTNYPGYRHLNTTTSNEFVALLVMSYADGTFKNTHNSEIHRSKTANLTNGRHREVAKGVISSIEMTR